MSIYDKPSTVKILKAVKAGYNTISHIEENCKKFGLHRVNVKSSWDYCMRANYLKNNSGKYSLTKDGEYRVRFSDLVN